MFYSIDIAGERAVQANMRTLKFAWRMFAPTLLSILGNNFVATLVKFTILVCVCSQWWVLSLCFLDDY